MRSHQSRTLRWASLPVFQNLDRRRASASTPCAEAEWPFSTRTPSATLCGSATSVSISKLPKYRAQLATLVDEAPLGNSWVHELKYDGYRMGCHIQGAKVQLESRSGLDWTSSFPELVDAAKALPVRVALLDGEVAMVLPNGTTNFQALQNAFTGTERAGLRYFVFDLLHLDGRDVSAMPLEKRKELCKALLGALPDRSPLRYSEHFETDGPTFFAHACKLGAEGIVSKRRDLPYRPGRNDGWVKTKCVKRQEFVIGGFTDPEGARAGLGALLLGYYEGPELRFAGKVGTGRGFTAAFLETLRQTLEVIQQDACPFVPRPPTSAIGRRAHWVKPVLIGEVSFGEWTRGGHIRHGSLRGLREDKPARTVSREVPAAEAMVARISSPDRIVYPKLGLTKLDIARFYWDVAEHALRYLAGRPLTLLRCEKGVSRSDALRTECKFLRHSAGWHRWAQPPIRRLAIREQKKVGEYLLVDCPEGLVALVQGDVIELHVWNSTEANLERPDRLVFDLDPGPRVHWRQVIEAAVLLRGHLDRVGLQSWVKLSGSRGLHLVVPFRSEHDWDSAHGFARGLAASVAKTAPTLLTIEYAKQSRISKILVDYKRNARAAVTVAAYSTRARPNAPVSVPIAWGELNEGLAPDAYTILNLRQHLRTVNEDPWREFWRADQRLELPALRHRR